MGKTFKMLLLSFVVIVGLLSLGPQIAKADDTSTIITVDVGENVTASFDRSNGTLTLDSQNGTLDRRKFILFTRLINSTLVQQDYETSDKRYIVNFDMFTALDYLIDGHNYTFDELVSGDGLLGGVNFLSQNGYNRQILYDFTKYFVKHQDEVDKACKYETTAWINKYVYCAEKRNWYLHPTNNKVKKVVTNGKVNFPEDSSYMFIYINPDNLDTSNWNMSNVKYTDFMFAYTKKCVEIDSFSENHGITNNKMRYYRSNTTFNLDGTSSTFEYNKNEKTEAIINGSERCYNYSSYIPTVDSYDKYLKINNNDLNDLYDNEYHYSGAYGNEVVADTTTISADIDEQEINSDFNETYYYDNSSAAWSLANLEKRITSIDLSNLDFSNVLTASYMFAYNDCSKIDFSNLNIGKIINAKGMFEKVTNTEDLDLTGVDLSSILGAADMFKDSTGVSFNLNCKMEKVLDASCMFSGIKVKYVDLEDLDISNAKYLIGLFKNSKIGVLSDFDEILQFKNAELVSGLFDGAEINLDNINKFQIKCNHNTTTGLGLFKGATITGSGDIVIEDFKDIDSLFENTTFSDDINITIHNVESITSAFKSLSSKGYLTLKVYNDKDVNLQFASGAFASCQVDELDLSKLDMSNIIDMNATFNNLFVKKSIKLSDTKDKLTKIKSIRGIFASKYNSDIMNKIVQHFDFSESNITDATGAFSGMIIEKDTIPIIESIKTVGKSVFDLFKNCTINGNIDLSNIDTSNLKTAESMFENCNIDGKVTLSNFIGSTVVNLENMFYKASSKGVDFGTIDTSNVVSMNKMFSESNSDTVNSDISNLNLKSVLYANNMFSKTDITDETLKSLDFTVFNPTDISYFISDCDALTNIEISDIKWTNIMDANNFMSNCDNIVSFSMSSKSSKDDMVKSTAYGSYFAENCPKLESFDLGNTPLYNFVHMQGFFKDNVVLNTIIGLNKPIKNVVLLQHLFDNCKELPTIDISDWIIKNINSMSYVFNNCENVESINLPSHLSTDKLNLQASTNMFNNCKKLTTFNINTLDFIEWSRNCENMYANCKSIPEDLLSTSFGILKHQLTLFESIPISYKNAYKGCTTLTECELFINNDNTYSHAGYNFTGIFSDCENLKSVKFKRLDESNSVRRIMISDMDGESLFNNDNKLEYVNLTALATSGKTSKLFNDTNMNIMEIRLPNITTSPISIPYNNDYNYFVCKNNDNPVVITKDQAKSLDTDMSGQTVKRGVCVTVNDNKRLSVKTEETDTPYTRVETETDFGDTSATILYDSSYTNIDKTNTNYKLLTKLPNKTRSKTGWTNAGISSNKESKVADYNYSSYTDLASCVGDDGITQLYSIWTPHKYTIRFNANGGTGSMDDLDVNYDDTIQLPINTFTNDSKMFKGWSFTPTGFVNVENLGTIYNLTDVENEVINLYAVWGNKAALINMYDRNKNLRAKAYIENNTSVNQCSTLIINDDTVDIEGDSLAGLGSGIIDFSDPNYTFNGWKYIDDDSIFNLNDVLTDTVNIYCDQTPNKYKLYLYTDPISNPTNKVVKTYTYGVGIKLPDVTKLGYKFNGWYKDLDDESSYVERITETDSGLITLYANFSLVDYNITYDYDGGNLANNDTNPDSYKVTDDDITLKNPTKTGYDFIGWIVDGEDDSTATDNMTISHGSIGNKSFKAIYKVINYNINYNYNGGLINKPNPTTYTVEDEITLNNPTKRGYDFKDWSDGTTNSNIYTISKGTTGDLSLEANYDLHHYTITINKNGGDFVNDDTVPTSYTINDSVTIPDVKKTGYTFKEWQDENGNSIGNIIEKDTIGDKVFNATYTVNDYNITYDYNGGNLPKDVTNPDHYNIEQSVVLNKPEKVGYTFDKWVDESDNEVSGTIDKGTTGDKTFKATWKANKYTITYNYDGGSLNENESNPDTYTIEDELILKTPNKDGFTFKEYRKDDNSVLKDNKIPLGSTGDLNLTAIYEKNKYSVQYIDTLKNGEISETNVDILGTKSENKEFDSIVRGSDLGNDTTISKYYTGRIYDSDTSSKVKVKDTIVYRYFVNSKHNVKFNPNGGKVNPTDKTVTYDNKYGDLPTPNKTGYTFTNWTDKDNNIITSDTIVITTDDEELIANYIPTSHNVTFDSNGGSPCNDITVTYDKPYGDLPTPTKNGYTFNGWTDENGNNITTSTTVTKTTDEKLIAKWKVNSYEVTCIDIVGTPDNIIENLGNSKQNIEFGKSISGSDFGKDTKSGAYYVGKSYKDCTSIVVSTANNIVYRIFETDIINETSYTIKYDINGGTLVGTMPKTYISSVGANLGSAKKTGYTFKYWQDKKTNKVFKDKIDIGTTGNLDLVAKYTVNKYKITYKLNGGKLSKTESKKCRRSYTINSSFTLGQPTKKDYSFTGWKLNNKGKANRSYKINKNTTGDLVFVATYQKTRVPDTYLTASKIINKGDTFKIKTLNIKGCKLKYTLSKKGIVSVNGMNVKAIKNGKTNLKYEVVDKKGYIIYRFGVNIQVKNTGINTLNTSNINKTKDGKPLMLLDKAFYLDSSWKCNFKDTKNAKITYKVKDKNIIKVDKNGVFKPNKKAGNTYVTIIVNQYGKTTKYLVNCYVENTKTPKKLK